MNMKPAALQSLVRAAACAALLAGGLFVGGCAATPHADLTAIRTQDDTAFKPMFDGAYVGRNDEGDQDVVLTSSSAEGENAKQIVHIRVLYRPMRAVRLDHPSATNASIRWIVTGQSPSDVMEYAGAGFVTISPHGDTSSLTVRNASLRPVKANGKMTDPLGALTLQGDIVARRDKTRVAELLAQVKATADAAVAAHTGAAGTGQPVH